MSKLSILTKAILTELYGVGPNLPQTQCQTCTPGSSSNLHHLIHKVADLDARLHKWKKEIPSQLHVKNRGTSSVKYHSAEEMDQDIGASGPAFENHIY